MSEPSVGEVLGLLAEWVEHHDRQMQAGDDRNIRAFNAAESAASEVKYKLLALKASDIRTLATAFSAAPAAPIQTLKVVWRERTCEYKANEDRASQRDSEIAANAWMGKGMELRRCLDELVSATALTPPAPASAQQVVPSALRADILSFIRLSAPNGGYDRWHATGQRIMHALESEATP